MSNIVDCSQSTKGTSFKEHTLKSMQVLNQLGGEGWRVLSTNWKFGVVLMEREIPDSPALEKTNSLNDGYYWTDIPGHSAPLEIVRVFGGHYVCIGSAHNRAVNGTQVFFGPIPKPPEPEPLELSENPDDQVVD